MPTVKLLRLTLVFLGAPTVLPAQKALSATDSVIRGPLLYKVVSGLSYSDQGKLGAPSVMGDMDAMLTVKNISESIVQTSIQGCPLRLRAYLNPSRSGPPDYSQFGPRSSCSSPVTNFSLEPGTIKIFRESVQGWDIAGGRKPLGPWYFAAEVYLPDTTLIFRGGQATFDPRLEHLGYNVQTRVVGVAPTSVVTTVTAYNRGADTLYLEYGDCDNNLTVFRNARKDGSGVWRSDRRTVPGTEWSIPCPTVLNTRKLAAGDSLIRTVSATTYDILADSLPAGRYYLNVSMEFNWRLVDFDAGHADLSDRWDPVPTSRIVRDIQYSGHLRRIHHANADSLELNLTVQNLSNRSRRLKLLSPSVYLFGYSNHTNRDTNYSDVRTDWRAKAIELPDFVLEPGEQHVFHGVVARRPNKFYYTIAFSIMDDADVIAASSFVTVAIDER